MNPNDANEILKTLNAMRWEVFLVLALAVVLWLVLRFLDRREGRLCEARAQEHKDVRADKYAEALNGLAAAFHRHDDRAAKNCESVNSALKQSVESLAKVEEKLGEISRKTQGRMSITDSLSIVEAYYSHLVRKVSHVVEQSLRENDYKRRREHVSRKVRTLFADEISSAREELRRISTLAFDSDNFFQTYVNDGDTSAVVRGGDRFVLCDTLWTAVEPCFEKRVETTAVIADRERDLQQRAEEAELILRNAAMDHFSACMHRLRKETSKALHESTRDSARAPLV